MIPSYIKKIVQFVGLCSVGFLVGTSSVTLVIAYLNYQAQDGPIFPAGLVATLLVIPVLIMLISLEVGIIGYEWLTGKMLGWQLLVVGVVGGMGGGVFLHQVLIFPYQDGLDLFQIGIFLVLGGLTGISVFGTHWVCNIVKIFYTFQKQLDQGGTYHE